MWLTLTIGGYKAEGVWRGGGEKQLLSPLLFQALFSSYPTLSFSKTLLFRPLPACLTSPVLQQPCLRPSLGRTTKWAVIGQLPALIVKPLDPDLCVFPLNLLFIGPSFSFPAWLPGFPSVSGGHGSTWATCHTASISAVTVLFNLSYDPCTIFSDVHVFLFSS